MFNEYAFVKAVYRCSVQTATEHVPKVIILQSF